jgi:glutamyl-tRNA reductase
VVAALRDRLEALRSAELERRRGQFGDLTEEQWSDIDAVTRAVLGKLVHDPTVVLKASAGTPRGERLVEALRQLFDL